MSGVKVIYEGRSISLDEWPYVHAFGEAEEVEVYARIIREGVLIDNDGKEFDALTAKLLRSELLGEPRYEPRSLGQSPRTEQSARWLIPDLWRWGTLPMLAGNPKAGKSSLVADLSAALTVPGRRFLDHFEPAEVETGETRYGEPTSLYVVVVNAENPPDAFQEELSTAGCFEGGGETFLDIFDLEEIGSPESFDVTDPVNYEAWLRSLTQCNDCDGTDFYTPTVLIVDGLTAILGGDTDRYGEWYPAFRRLMREVGIPNALVTAHATLAGNHLMGGTEAQAGADGLWRYSSANGDDPDSPRYFSVVPRMGGAKVPKTRVHRGEDGRLRLASSPVPPSAQATVPETSPQEEAEARITEKLRAAGTTGARKTEVTGRGAGGKWLRPVLDQMIEDGRVVVEEERAGRNTAYRCWLPEFAPHLDIDLTDT